MFKNFRSARYIGGTIFTGPWTPLLPGLFFADTFCAERPIRRFSRDTGRVFLWSRHSTPESPSPRNNFVCPNRS
jgi:hypothetical protein